VPGGLQMAVHWVRTSDVFDRHDVAREAVPISPQFGIAEALRRTIVSFSATLEAAPVPLVDYVVGWGMTVAIQLTRGNPPPPPASPVVPFPGSDDFLHLEILPGRIVAGGNPNLFYVQFPGDGRGLLVDTPTQRLSHGQPYRLWLGWDLPSTSSPVEGNLKYAFSASMLIEVV